MAAAGSVLRTSCIGVMLQREAVATHFCPMFIVRALLCLTLGFALCVIGSFSHAQSTSAATEARRQFDVSAGTLDQALSRFGRQAGIPISVNAEMTSGLNSPGVSGTHTVSEALQLLLIGTGLEAVQAEDGTYSLRKLPAASPAVQKSEAVPVEQELPEVKVVSEVEVHARYQSSPYELPLEYAGGQVARGGRLGILGNRDMMDTPFNQTVFTERLIQDLQAQSIGEVIQSDPSVTYTGGAGETAEFFNIRGFGVTSGDLAFNGLFGVTPSLGSLMMSESVERIEVLKGPSALLSGIAPGFGGGVGGTINVVPKRAGDTPLIQFTPSYTSDSQWGGHIDLGRRFGADNQLGIRTNFAYRSGSTPVDEMKEERALATLALDYRTSSFRGSADIGYQSVHTDGYLRTLSLAANVPVLSAPENSTNWSQPWTYKTMDTLYGALRGEVDIVESVTVYVTAGGNRNDFGMRRIDWTVVDTQGTLTGSSLRENARRTQWTIESGLRASFSTGPVDHEAVISYSNYWQNSGSERIGRVNVADSNLYNPTFIPDPGLARPADFDDLPVLDKFHNSSLAVADTLSVLDGRIQLTAGLRWQKVKVEDLRPADGPLVYDESTVSPSVGVIFKPANHISLYANYIEGLRRGSTAPIDAANAGEVFPPSRTKQKEVGVKVDVENVALTLSAFDIIQPNFFTDPATNVYALDGEQVNRGVEFTAFGEIYGSFRFFGGAAYIDASLTKTAGGVNQDNDPVGVPSIRTNLGVEWDVPYMSGLTVLGRVTYTSESEFNQENTKQIPSSMVFDVGARLKLASAPIIIRANIYNVFDRDYWVPENLWMGPPRTFRLSATFSF